MEIVTLERWNTPLKRRHYIKCELGMRGWRSITAFAKHLGVKPQAISNAFNAPSSHIEQAIADEIGVPVQELFWDRYDVQTGERLYVEREQQRSITQKRYNDQSVASA